MQRYTVIVERIGRHLRTIDPARYEVVIHSCTRAVDDAGTLVRAAAETTFARAWAREREQTTAVAALSAMLLVLESWEMRAIENKVEADRCFRLALERLSGADIL